MTLAAQLADMLSALLAGRASEEDTRKRLRAIVGAPQLALIGHEQDAAPAPDLHDVANRLFDYWKRTCNHPNAKADPTRLAKAMARLRDGFSEQELRWAIDGMAGSEFHSGSNDGGKRYDDLELCFRNIRNVERFIESARGRGMASPREERDDQKSKLRAAAQKAMRDGRTDDYNRLMRELRSA